MARRCLPSEMCAGHELLADTCLQRCALLDVAVDLIINNVQVVFPLLQRGVQCDIQPLAELLQDELSPGHTIASEPKATGVEPPAGLCLAIKEHNRFIQPHDGGPCPIQRTCCLTQLHDRSCLRGHSNQEETRCNHSIPWHQRRPHSKLDIELERGTAHSQYFTAMATCWAGNSFHFSKGAPLAKS